MSLTIRGVHSLSTPSCVPLVIRPPSASCRPAPLRADRRLCSCCACRLNRIACATAWPRCTPGGVEEVEVPTDAHPRCPPYHHLGHRKPLQHSAAAYMPRCYSTPNYSTCVRRITPITILTSIVLTRPCSRRRMGIIAVDVTAALLTHGRLPDEIDRP